MTTNITSYDYDDLMDGFRLFMQSQEEFKDYDFDGAGIRQILRLLSYNTQIQAFENNFLFNELDLNTADLRENVASRAGTLGYLPGGYRCATLFVKVMVKATDLLTAPTRLTMNKQVTFFANKDGQVLQFSPDAEYSANLNNDGYYVFEKVALKQGVWNYTAFESSSATAIEQFIIPNAKVDADSIRVNVYASDASTAYERFVRFNNAFDMGKDERVFYLREGRGGLYNLNFGDGRMSKRLDIGNVVVAEYMVTEGAAGNNVSSLTPGSGIGNFFDIQVEALEGERSFGGADPEPIESIKAFAPMVFASRGNAVSDGDYVAITRSLFSEADKVNAWGGELNDPPKFGYTMVAVKPKNAKALTAEQKKLLTSLLAERNVGSVTPIVVDPDWTFIDVDLVVKYDNRATVLTEQSIRAKVEDGLRKYSASKLEFFQSSFESSNCASFVRDLDPSFRGVQAEFRYSKKFKPELNFNGVYEFKFNRGIRAGSVSVSGFTVADLDYEGYEYQIVDESGVLVLQKRRAEDGFVAVLNKNIGSVEYDIGLVRLSGFRPISLTGEDALLVVRPDSADQSIDGLRDSILSIGTINVTPRS